MIIYNPLDGIPIQGNLPSRPRHCFLMTKLGMPIPDEILLIRETITECCRENGFEIINAQTIITGRDFLLKIWQLIASSPVSIGIAHQNIPVPTQLNIYYEIGVAQALGKETLLVKGEGGNIPSDFVRSEYIKFNEGFRNAFMMYLEGLNEVANYYRTLAEQLERNPLLALDYLKRAYLISGDETIRAQARAVADEANFADRAANSIEILASDF